MRFTLTAGQKGDAPQAAALIEGFAAEVVMADTAYDADHLRQAIAAKGALAVVPNNPSRALKYPLDKQLYAQRHLVECCFSSLSSSGASQAASRKRLGTIRPWSPWPRSFYACDKCPQEDLAPSSKNGNAASGIYFQRSGIYFERLLRFASRTPTPPPFSGMNSTPALSSAFWTASFTSSETFGPLLSSLSSRLMVGKDRPAASASCVWDQPSKPRAARICSTEIIVEEA